MIARVRDVSYWYPQGEAPALEGVDVDVEEASLVLLAGPSAGGKSTLLRLFNGLVPQFHGGRLTGWCEVAGMNPAQTPSRRMATVAGMVFQEPESQAVADTVEDDIAFGMEQQGVPVTEMRRRMKEVLGALGIEPLRYRRLATLSGGERQRAAIAAVLALEPRMLLLDEPTSQVDPEGAVAVIGAVQRLHRERGLTVLAAEHRLERLLPVVGSVLEVESGRVRQMRPREAAGQLRAVPAVCELGRRLGLAEMPLTVEEARAALAGGDVRVEARETNVQTGPVLLEAERLTVAYGETVALREASLTLRAGEVVALVGANGSGKTTLFRALTGLAKPVSGRVRFEGSEAPGRVQERTALAGLVPQDPALALYHEIVREEVAAGLKARGRGREAAPLEAWGVAHLAERNPRDVSVGQQQRVAMAAMLAHGPRVWLMDEPTRGADAESKAWLAERLRAHAAASGAAVVATHDVESAAQYATRVVGLKGGAVAFDLPVREALGAGGPLPTQTARVVPGALRPEEVVR